MWVKDKENWFTDSSSLESYFIEKLIQKVDQEESISNKHRTSNGVTLVSEIVKVCEKTLSRPKSINRLISLLEESKHKNITCNILNDRIIKNHFPHIRNHFQNFNSNELKNGNEANEKLIKKLLKDSKLFLVQLENYYHTYLLQELKKFKYQDETNFETKVKLLNHYIDLLVTNLIHMGYSSSSIKEVAVKVSVKKNPVNRLIKIFKNEEFEFKYIIRVPQNLSNDFDRILYILLNELEFKAKEVTGMESLLPYTEEGDKFIEILATSLDPHSFIRNLYDKLLKSFVKSKERVELSFFNDFFNNSFWKWDNDDDGRFSKVVINHDPINVTKRESTLRKTLNECSEHYNLNFDDSGFLPNIPCIEQSYYFYNLALGSKSIENSLSLLWTSLETLYPFIKQKSDIESIQEFATNCLSIGAISRDLRAFVLRLIHNNKVNKNHISDNLHIPNKNIKTEQGLYDWFYWVANMKDDDNKYETLKDCSDLLSYDYCKLSLFWNQHKIKDLKTRIDSSKCSISYQLDRIYLHRNQIVHSGQFINEYSNLWFHLEWYIGKLLSVVFIKAIKGSINSEEDLKNCFIELYSDTQFIDNYFEQHPERTIIDSTDLHKVLFKHVWLSF